MERPDLEPGFWPSYQEPTPMANAIQQSLTDPNWHNRVLNAYVKRNHGVSEDVSYILEWQTGARPPVHPKSMTGQQRFESIEKARHFFNRQAPDAKFLSLTKVTTIKEDISDAFRKG